MTTAQHPRRARPWILAACLLLAGLVLVELYLRSFIYKQPEDMANDPDWGYKPAAGTTVVYGVEGFGVTHYSADGEIATPYEGSTPVVVLGDSFTEAWQVDDDRKYVSMAEVALREQGIQADLHNLGTSGLNLPDYLYRRAQVEPRYHPQVVVLQLERSDFVDPQLFDSSRVNYFVMDTDDSLELRHQPAEVANPVSIPVQLKRNLSLVSYGYYRLNEIRGRIAQKYSPPAGSVTAASPALPMDEEALLQAGIQALREAYAGVPLVILLTPDVPRLQEGMLLLESAEYDDFRRALQAVPEWVVVDPLPDLRALYEQEGRLPFGFHNSRPGSGHLNEDGHAIYGRLLAEALKGVLQ